MWYMNNKQDLGAKIRQLRLKHKKSQEELGKALDRSHAAVSDIELGKTDLSVRDLTIIAGFFNAPITTFLEEQPQKSFPAFSQNRYAKNITPAQLNEANTAARNFDDHVAKLAQKQNK